MLTPFQLFGVLSQYAYPGLIDLRMNNGAACFTIEGVTICYTHHGWIAFGHVIPDELPDPSTIYHEQVHVEIRRVLAIVKDDEDSRRDVEQALAKMTADRDEALTNAADLKCQLDALKRERHNAAVRDGERIQDLNRQLRAVENQRRAAIAALTALES